jgi:hypothetical protein
MYWEVIRENGKKSMSKGTKWESLVEKKKYRITEVTEKKLVIKRVSGGEDVVLTRAAVEKAIPKLIEKGKLSKSKLSETVAKESMMIHLHPSIGWNATLKEIYWQGRKKTTASEVEEYIKNADNDTLNKIQAWITQRENQGKFKKNILKLYNNKCAITGCKVAETLDAAHIEPHSENGNNQNNNGILMRADIHKLFDRGLLKINPDIFKVQVDAKIKDPEYMDFNGRVIKKTKEGT